MDIDTLRGRRQDLRDAIWTHGPEHFNMSQWVHDPKNDDEDDDIAAAAGIDLNACGTTCCVAGHGAKLMGGAHCELEVAEHFGLPIDLFHRGYWTDLPFKDGRLATFEETYGGDMTSADEWGRALDYLDWIIKENVIP